MAGGVVSVWLRSGSTGRCTCRGHADHRALTRQPGDYGGGTVGYAALAVEKRSVEVGDEEVFHAVSIGI